MDSCSLSDWNTDVGFGSPIPSHRKPALGLENELVELLWENGDVVLHNQTQRKQPTTRPSDDETISWITSPINESFENEFSNNFLSDFNSVFPNSQLPPPRFEAFGSRKTGNVDLKTGCSHNGRKNPLEDSIMTIGSSHCASNQVNNEMDMSYRGSRTFEENYTETCTREQAITTSSGGSGSSFWKPSDVSNDTNRHKRKKCDMQESQCQSDATELESGAGNKSSQKPGTSRRTRVAEVHNLSERRRRDRINEKMRALQEVIPHSNKSDKASMLDEAIEYMKSLQLQIQLMWMGTGMAPMMIPGMQHYMSRLGTGPTPPIHPAIQNLMRLSRFPIGDQAINMAPTTNQLGPMGQTHPMLSPVFYQTQMQNSRLAEQYANYMSFHSTQNTLQPISMFNFGTNSAQQNHVLAPPGNGD